MVYVDCFYYGFNISYEELQKYDFNKLYLNNFTLYNNINYTTFEEQQQSNLDDDEVKKILNDVKEKKLRTKEEKPKPSLTKKKSYFSIEDELLYLNL
jgi:hypothetical protein